MSQFFTSGGQRLEFQLQHQSSNEHPGPISFRMESPCSPRDSQGSSPTPQFKNINSSMFSVLYGPTLTSGYHYWKNHNFDYTDLCRKVISLLFNTLSRFVIAFLPRKKCLLILEQVFCFVLFCFNIGASVPSSKDQVSFNFMAAVIVCSDFGAQENKICKD